MTTENLTLNSLVPVASFFSPGFAVDATAAQSLDLWAKKPSYGYDDEDEDDGYDDDEEDEDYDDDEDEDEDGEEGEDSQYDDEEEDYDDEDEDEDDDEDDDEDEDEDIGYYTRFRISSAPSDQLGSLASIRNS